MDQKSQAEHAVRVMVVALVREAGGQRALGRELGIPQAPLSRFLAGGNLTLPMARRLFVAFPQLRHSIRVALLDAVADREEVAESA